MKIKKIKLKKWEKRARIGKKWGILKYLSAEISFEKSKIIPDQRTCASGVLGQKLGYDSDVHLFKIVFAITTLFYSNIKSDFGSHYFAPPPYLHANYKVKPSVPTK